MLQRLSILASQMCSCVQPCGLLVLAVHSQTAFLVLPHVTLSSGPRCSFSVGCSSANTSGSSSLTSPRLPCCPTASCAFFHRVEAQADTLAGCICVRLTHRDVAADRDIGWWQLSSLHSLLRPNCGLQLLIPIIKPVYHCIARQGSPDEWAHLGTSWAARAALLGPDLDLSYPAAMLAAPPGGSPLAVTAQGCGIQGCICFEVPLSHQVRALGSQRLAQAHSEAAAWTEKACLAVWWRASTPNGSWRVWLATAHHNKSSMAVRQDIPALHLQLRELERRPHHIELIPGMGSRDGSSPPNL